MSADQWKDVLDSHKTEIQELEAMDSALNNDLKNDEIEKIINKTKKNSTSGPSRTKIPPSKVYTNKNGPSTPPPYSEEGDNASFGDLYGLDVSPSPHKPNKLTKNPLASSSTSHGPQTPINPSTAPETADRYAKAKVKLLTKQLEDGLELRKKMDDQNKDLQRQLKGEREENKKLQKRIQQLELDIKRMNNSDRRHSDPVARGDTPESLHQEIASLKKDLDAAQRIIKQHESHEKTKDTQLKRAAETISRLKSQLQENQEKKNDAELADSFKAKLDEADSRIKTLEGQKVELIEGFKKQLKLIDILKRQKVHIEAARLLAFTEDEFMNVLDWNT